MPSLELEIQREQLWNRRFDPNVADINQLCDSLKELKPGSSVPYVDPMHDVGECRIISLYSSVGTAADSGYISAGDDDAATRMLGVYWQVGLKPEYVMPWNAYPWFVPGEPNGRLTKEQIAEGVKPLLKFLALVPRASAIVAHGTEAHRLAAAFLKTENRMIYRRSFKTYKVRAADSRGLGGSVARQEQGLEEMHVAYADAMARTGLAALNR
ncbi:MAG: uracil-DNA glycosylase [Actinomycetota bacterium]|nr:uracil-DNA glycosylase [Actinomycetota bacterium]